MAQAETATVSRQPQKSGVVPLVVDLDGTLLRGDLLVESAFAHLGDNLGGAFGLIGAVTRGKAALKDYIASRTEIDVTQLPFNEQVLDLIRTAKAAGRPVYIASASDQRYVGRVAEHLGLFDGWFASDGARNLSSRNKAEVLVAQFGEGGFDYVGNDAADLAVWAKASACTAVDPAPAVWDRLLKIDPGAQIIRTGGNRLRAWLKLLRVHQWSKNALIFVPLITAHQFDPQSILHALMAFIAFSLAASGIYLINDLADLDADRRHLTKRNRPLAAGVISLVNAMAAAPVLVIASVVLAFLTTPMFGCALLGYLALTTAYTFVLKRKMMIDVVTLATLYTLRVIGGGLATSVPVTEWLLAFSIFIFLSLALMKRYIELAGRLDNNLPDATNRNYRKVDLDIVAALGAASSFNAVTVFALYVSSDQVRMLYTRPQLLWVICPILLYWTGRILMLAHRRVVDEDPITFAIKDRISLITVAAIGAVLLLAK